MGFESDINIIFIFLRLSKNLIFHVKLIVPQSDFQKLQLMFKDASLILKKNIHQPQYSFLRASTSDPFRFKERVFVQAMAGIKAKHGSHAPALIRVSGFCPIHVIRFFVLWHGIK